MEKKNILTLRLKNNIQNEEWEKLIPALPLAEEFKVSPQLLKKAWIFAGEYSISKKDWTSAIIQFNKARVKSPSAIFVFDKLIQAIDSFYNQFKDVLSREDLNKLKEVLQMIVDYHELNYPKHKTVIDIGRKLLIKVDYRRKYAAEDKAETPATYKINEIKNALYGDMTAQEIRDEFAKIIEDDIRFLLSEKKKNGKKKKKLNKKKK